MWRRVTYHCQRSVTELSWKCCEKCVWREEMEQHLFRPEDVQSLKHINFLSSDPRRHRVRKGFARQSQVRSKGEERRRRGGRTERSRCLRWHESKWRRSVSQKRKHILNISSFRDRKWKTDFVLFTSFSFQIQFIYPLLIMSFIKNTINWKYE